jgi:hypothetical protein
MILPGNANLPIGDAKTANREIGVPRFNPIKFIPSHLTSETALFWFS